MADAVCIACSRSVKANQLAEAKDEKYHKRCFRCVECFVTPNLETFKRIGASVYCVKCAPEDYSEEEEEEEEKEYKCAICRRVVYESDVCHGKTGEDFHRRCFRCEVCFNRLSGSDYIKQGRSIWCDGCKPSEKPAATTASNDTSTSSSGFLSNAASSPKRSTSPSPRRAAAFETCSICNATIRPHNLLDVEGSKYHKACFRCQICRTQLEAGKYAKRFNEYYCNEHDPDKPKPSVSVDVEADKLKDVEKKPNGFSPTNRRVSMRSPVRGAVRHQRQHSNLQRVVSLKVEPNLEEVPERPDYESSEEEESDEEEDDADEEEEEDEETAEARRDRIRNEIREEERERAREKIRQEKLKELGEEGVKALEIEIKRVNEEEEEKRRVAKAERDEWLKLDEAGRHKQIQEQLQSAEKEYYDNMLGDLIKMKRERIEEIERSQAEKRIRKRVRKLRKKLNEIEEREQRKKNRYRGRRRVKAVTPGERALSVDRIESKRRAFEMLGMSDSEMESSDDDSLSDSDGGSGQSDVSISMSRRSVSRSTRKPRHRHKRSRSYDEPAINILDGEELSVKLSLKLNKAKIVLSEDLAKKHDTINPFCTVIAKDIDGVPLEEHKTSVVKETLTPYWKSRFTWSHMHQIHKVEFSFYHTSNTQTVDIEMDAEGKVQQSKKKKKKFKKKKQDVIIEVASCSLNVRRSGTGSHKMKCKLKNHKQKAGTMSITWKYQERVIRAGKKAVDFDTTVGNGSGSYLDVHSIPNFLKDTKDLLQDENSKVRGHLPRSLSAADKIRHKKSPGSRTRSSKKLHVPGTPRSQSVSGYDSPELSRSRKSQSSRSRHKSTTHSGRHRSRSGNKKRSKKSIRDGGVKPEE